MQRKKSETRDSIGRDESCVYLWSLDTGVVIGVNA